MPPSPPRATSLFRSLSNATTVQPRAARAMALSDLGHPLISRPPKGRRIYRSGENHFIGSDRRTNVRFCRSVLPSLNSTAIMERIPISSEGTIGDADRADSGSCAVLCLVLIGNSLAQSQRRHQLARVKQPEATVTEPRGTEEQRGTDQSPLVVKVAPTPKTDDERAYLPLLDWASLHSSSLAT
jgi:hypothetical protein